MVNTLGRSRFAGFSSFVLLSLILFVKGICAILSVLIVLFLSTENFFDYRNLDLNLIFQLLPFLALFFGIVYSFFKMQVSGYIILIASAFFWVSTSIFRNQFWLGWFYLVFPLTGGLLVLLAKIDTYKKQRKKRKIISRKGNSK